MKLRLLAHAVAASLLLVGERALGSDQDPTLAESEHFLNEHGRSEATIANLSIPIDRAKPIVHRRTFTVRDCTAAVVSSTFPADEEDTGESRIVRASRSELSHAVLERVQIDGFYWKPEYSLYLMTSSSVRFNVGAFDETMGNRMKKALDHWLELCAGSKEPF